MHVGLVAEDHRRRQRAHGLTVLLFVIGDGAHDLGVLLSRHAETFEHVLAEQRGGDAVIQPVDAVAQVMKVAGNGGQLCQPA